MGSRKKFFRVCFLVEAERLPTIVSLLSGEVGGLNVSEHIPEGNLSPAPTTKNKKEMRGVKDASKTRSGSLILEFMEPNRVYKTSEISKYMEEKGYIGSTASATLSRLVKEGKVERTTYGEYKKI